MEHLEHAQQATLIGTDAAGAAELVVTEYGLAQQSMVPWQGAVVCGDGGTCTSREHRAVRAAMGVALWRARHVLGSDGLAAGLGLEPSAEQTCTGLPEMVSRPGPLSITVMLSPSAMSCCHTGLHPPGGRGSSPKPALAQPPP